MATTGDGETFDEVQDGGGQSPQFHPFSGLRGGDLVAGCDVTRKLLNRLAAIQESGGVNAQGKINGAVVNAIYGLEQLIIAGRESG